MLSGSTEMALYANFILNGKHTKTDLTDAWH